MQAWSIIGVRSKNMDENLKASAEMTVNTIRKIRGLMEFLRAMEVKENIAFYLVIQVIDLISLDPGLAEEFIQDRYDDGDWKFLWGQILSRVGIDSQPLAEGEF